MLVVLLDMFINISIRKRALRQLQENQVANRDKRFQRQLFFLMLSSICVFLITTLPLAIYRVVFPKQVFAMTVPEYASVMSISAGLTWFSSFNYAVRYIFDFMFNKYFLI